MYTAYVVTHRGPCMVPKDMFQKITTRRAASSQFGEQILFSLEVDLDTIEFRVVRGEIPMITKMDEFEERFLVTGPPVVRVITL